MATVPVHGQRPALRAIVRHALRKLSADTQPADVEDVAVTCFRLAPSLFAMERHPEFPRVDTAYYALKNLKPSGDVTGGLRVGWTLTRKGAAWLSENEVYIMTLLGDAESMETPHGRDAKKKLDRILRHEALAAFRRGQRPEVSRQELADMLGLSAGSMQERWQANFSKSYAIARENAPEILAFLDMLEEAHPELLKGGR
jgi:hypothetical protein